MGEYGKKHSDCENFAPVDVTKGICRLSNELILIDTAVCVKFDQIATCKACRNFHHPDADGIGVCAGLGKEYWTAGIYKAGLCEGYIKSFPQ